MTDVPLSPSTVALPGGIGSRIRSSRSLRFVVFRLGRALLVVVAATMLTMALLNRTPGGLSASILGEAASPEAIEELDRELGLDRPFLAQYREWASGVLGGDLGTSPIDQRPVWDSLTEALPVTLEIVVLATTIAFVGAVGLSLLSARRPGGVADRVSTGISSVALAVPTFVLAPVLVYLFAVRFQWLPVTGWTPLSEDPVENLRTAILPAVAVALPELAVFQRLFRDDLVATLDEEYVDAARARGIGETRILFRHAVRPASIALVTAAGLSIGRLLGGTVIVESLFTLPGVGGTLQQAIIRHDFVTVQGFVVFLSVSYVVINLVVDLLYGAIDPRLRATR